ncbi:MAG: hypothetical protein ACXADW_14175 [Candidatus Hodarchaeales archaeon]|jgi:hypothetical protein
MDEPTKELKIYQILSGKHFFKYQSFDYVSVVNTIDEIYAANIKYQEIVEDNKYENFMNLQQSFDAAHRLGIWTYSDEEQYKSMEKLLEDSKLEIYLSASNPDHVRRLKRQIKNITQGLDRSIEKKHHFYHATIEFYANELKEYLLLGTSIRDKYGQRVYNIYDFDNWQSDLVDTLKYVKQKNRIPTQDVRLLSRVDPGRTLWSTSKQDIFEHSSPQWNVEQKLFVSFSRMYDGVYESMECPPDNIIADDDMLDGWFIKQKRDRDNKLKDKQTDDKFSKFKNKDGQELFIMANNRQDVSQIYDMNDSHSLAKLRLRQKTLKNTEGDVKHQNLPDVRMDMQMQATEEMRQNIRKKFNG